MSLAPGKKQLRTQLAARLKQVPKSAIEAHSRAVVAAVRALPEYRAAKTVGYYMHIEQPDVGQRKSGRLIEIETDELIAAAFADGKSVFLPRIVDASSLETPLAALLATASPSFRPTTVLQMLQQTRETVAGLRVLGDGKHTFNIREPDSGADALAGPGLDLLIVPGLGFAANGRRLGRGKGFYDTFIAMTRVWAASRARPAPFLVGVGLPEQLVDADAIPIEPHDAVLDAVVIAGNVLR
ncbi:uncharacterized protein V1510DRAFT_410640 [Dipodascopsis tothii]|uniref:uncharacterized protein n=1 Tax=Dipodascopsis tothii TaxID=44089 RepID=UPI0034CF6CE4